MFNMKSSDSSPLKLSVCAGALMFAASIVLSGGTAIAQGQQDGYGQGYENPDPSSANVTDAQLQAFADAQDAIAAIQQDWQSQIESGAVDPNNQNAAAEVRERMAAAVEEQGLTVSEYNEIYTALQTDSSLMDRYQQL